LTHDGSKIRFNCHVILPRKKGRDLTDDRVKAVTCNLTLKGVIV